MSLPAGLVMWTSPQKAREAAKAATQRTGIRHRAAKTSCLDIDWDATPITWTEVPLLHPRPGTPEGNMMHEDKARCGP